MFRAMALRPSPSWTAQTRLSSSRHRISGSRVEHIERIRGMTAQKIGFVEDYMEARTKATSAPKVSIVSAPQDYVNMDGKTVPADAMDLCVRAISVGMLHKAYPMTVAVASGAAAKTPGTIVSELARSVEGDIIRLGHSSGVTEVDMKMEGEKVLKGGVTRTPGVENDWETVECRKADCDRRTDMRFTKKDI